MAAHQGRWLTSRGWIARPVARKDLGVRLAVVRARPFVQESRQRQDVGGGVSVFSTDGGCAGNRRRLCDELGR